MSWFNKDFRILCFFLGQFFPFTEWPVIVSLFLKMVVAMAFCLSEDGRNYFDLDFSFLS